MKKALALVVITSVMMACGNVSVTIPESAYAPKISIQGILVPGQLAHVKITRNFPVTAVVDPAKITITDANLSITDGGTEYQLLYNPQTQLYESSQLNVGYGRTYTLNAAATIDGQRLQASATTTVPNAGLKVLADESRLGSMVYRQRDAQGNLVNFNVVFDRSPGTGYYLVSLVALEADTSRFIYDNPFRELTAEEVLGDFEEYKYNYFWIQDRPLTPGISNVEIPSVYIFFYTQYRVILYAADRNFRDFQTTHELLQGLDGNYHEPVFHIDGDGIGVFGSAVVDTAYFEVLRP